MPSFSGERGVEVFCFGGEPSPAQLQIPHWSRYHKSVARRRWKANPAGDA
jgi:hypothetical protein